MPRPRLSGRSPPSSRATKARSRRHRSLTSNASPRSGPTPWRKRLPIRVFLWMNTTALSAPPKMTRRSAQSSLNVFRVPAIRGVGMNSSHRMTEAQQIAQTAGIVVGAASCCEQVTEERINPVAVKLRELVAETADDDTDADLANEQFSAVLEMGKTAVESGRIAPERAEVALNELEEELWA